MKSLDLDVATPDEAAPVLREAAQQFKESASELQIAWHDKRAGGAWVKIARILVEGGQLA